MKDDSRSFSRSTKRKATIISITAVAVAVIAFLSGSAFVRGGASADIKKGARGEVTASQQGQNRGRLETELLTLQQTGFEPNEITRPQGAFILGVDNRSGLEEVEFRFEKATGERLTALQAPRRKITWREVVDLAPGQYVLSESNHPEWTCNITIVPR